MQFGIREHAKGKRGHLNTHTGACTHTYTHTHTSTHIHAVRAMLVEGRGDWLNGVFPGGHNYLCGVLSGCMHKARVHCVHKNHPVVDSRRFRSVTIRKTWIKVRHPQFTTETTHRQSAVSWAAESDSIPTLSLLLALSIILCRKLWYLSSSLGLFNKCLFIPSEGRALWKSEGAGWWWVTAEGSRTQALTVESLSLWKLRLILGVCVCKRDRQRETNSQCQSASVQTHDVCMVWLRESFKNTCFNAYQKVCMWVCCVCISEPVNTCLIISWIACRWLCLFDLN